MKYRFWSVEKKAVSEQGQDEPQDNRFVKLVNSIIRFAVQKKASDIHFEVLNPEKMRVRIRIDGELITTMEVAKKDYLGMISRIKILSGLDISEKRRPQDGSFCFETEGRKIDLRVSVVPTVYSEKVVLRILDAQTFLISVRDLGLSFENEQRVRGMLNQANGLLLVTGPTGDVNLPQVKYYKKMTEKSLVSGSKIILSITFRQNCCCSSRVREV